MALTAWRMTTESGHQWSTSMANGLTKAEVEKYFIGAYVNIGVYPEEKPERVVKVEEL